MFEGKFITNKEKDLFLKELVDNYKLMVVNTCYGFVHCPHDAKDIAQEVFIEVWEKMEFFRGESKISTWIYRIAVNKSLNYLRQNKKNVVLGALESMKDSLLNYVTEASYEEKDDKKNKLKIIHKAIDKLPERQKSAFVLYHYEGLDYKEIAEVTDTTVSTVESLLFRARTNLKKYLKDFNYCYEK